MNLIIKNYFLYIFLSFNNKKLELLTENIEIKKNIKEYDTFYENKKKSILKNMFDKKCFLTYYNYEKDHNNILIDKNSFLSYLYYINSHKEIEIKEKNKNIFGIIYLFLKILKKVLSFIIKVFFSIFFYLIKLYGFFIKKISYIIFEIFLKKNFIFFILSITVIIFNIFNIFNNYSFFFIDLLLKIFNLKVSFFKILINLYFYILYITCNIDFSFLTNFLIKKNYKIATLIRENEEKLEEKMIDSISIENFSNKIENELNSSIKIENKLISYIKIEKKVLNKISCKLLIDFKKNDCSKENNHLKVQYQVIYDRYKKLIDILKKSIFSFKNYKDSSLRFFEETENVLKFCKEENNYIDMLSLLKEELSVVKIFFIRYNNIINWNETKLKNDILNVSYKMYNIESIGKTNSESIYRSFIACYQSLLEYQMKIPKIYEEKGNSLVGNKNFEVLLKKIREKKFYNKILFYKDDEKKFIKNITMDNVIFLKDFTFHEGGSSKIELISISFCLISKDKMSEIQVLKDKMSEIQVLKDNMSEIEVLKDKMSELKKEKIKIFEKNISLSFIIKNKNNLYKISLKEPNEVLFLLLNGYFPQKDTNFKMFKNIKIEYIVSNEKNNIQEKNLIEEVFYDFFKKIFKKSI
jgi:hypothetical protein